jgi:hypothetical protein
METGNTIPLINGREYAWSDISIRLLGRTIIGITSIDYGDEQKKDYHYGQGNMPQNFTRGQYKAHAKCKLQMKELVALQKSVPEGQYIQAIGNFPVIVSYLNDENEVVTDIINNCSITSNGRQSNAGGGVIEHEIDLSPSHIKWHQG